MTMGPYECNNCGAEVTAHGNTDGCARCSSVVRELELTAGRCWPTQPPDDVTRALLKAYREVIEGEGSVSSRLDVAIAAYRAAHGDPP